MANEITATTLTNQILTELIQAQVGEAIREKSILLPICDVQDISNVPTNTASWQLHNTMTVKTITDGTAIANSAYSQTNVTCAAAQYGVMFTMTDFGLNATVADHSVAIPQNAMADVVQKIDEVIAALLDTFTGTTQQVGTSGSNLTFANCIDAVTNLRTNAQGLAENGVFVLHPRQVGDLMLASEGYYATGLTTGQAVSITPLVTRTDFIDIFGDGKALKSVAGTLLGLPVLQTNLVPLVNTNADRGGALVVAGRFGALGVCMKKLPSVELQRSVSNGIVGWTGIVDSAFNAVELRDLLGVSIITDA